MRFSSREDIAASIEQVFEAVTDFDGFERQALRRGAEVQRSDDSGAAGIGTEWRVKFKFRGKDRKMKARLTQFEVPNGYVCETQTGGLEGTLTIDLLSLSPKRTRLNVSLELQAKTLAGRLLVQSLKFARGNLTKRFSNRVWTFAQDVESRYG